MPAEQTETVVIRRPALFGAALAASDDTTFVLDCTVSEQHTRGAELTDHPVENGATVSDHVRLRPRELSLAGIHSLTPLRAADIDEDRDLQAWAELERIWRLREPLTVITSLQVYTNMVLVELSTARTALIGQAIQPQMRFREVFFVEPSETKIPPELIAPEVEDADEEADEGDVPTEEATEEEEAALEAEVEREESLLHQSFEAIRGIFGG